MIKAGEKAKVLLLDKAWEVLGEEGSWVLGRGSG
jgi:hypothetical protein